jgi:cardiolipin synthase
VKLIVPRSSNHRVTFHAGRSFYDELLATGVKIHEYVPGMLHTKAMIVDGRFATVGSANLDVRSFRLNFEMIAVLYGPADVARLTAIFDEDLAQTDEVDLERWRNRAISTRMKEGFGRLCSPLL